MLPTARRLKKAAADNPKKLASLIDLANLPSPLRDFLGKSLCSRLTCFIRVWSYIKTNNLQAPSSIRSFNFIELCCFLWLFVRKSWCLCGFCGGGWIGWLAFVGRWCRVRLMADCLIGCSHLQVFFFFFVRLRWLLLEEVMYVEIWYRMVFFNQFIVFCYKFILFG